MENKAETKLNHPHAKELTDLIAGAISFCREKNYEEALKSIEEALGIEPKFFPALVEKGIILLQMGRFEEAIECYDLYLKRINNVQVRKLRDNCLGLALANYDRILAESATNLEALTRRAGILQRLNRFKDALYSYNLALELYSKRIVDLLNKRGNSLLSLDDPRAALESYNRALQLSPKNGALYFNRGNVLQQLGRMDEALASYSRALVYRPDLAEARMETSHCRLATGDYEGGFPEYESRWQTKQLQPARLKTSTPLWLGKEDLAGKTILLWGEQGFGDSIQFMRYVPIVARSAGRTIFLVPALLRSLAQTLDCSISITVQANPLPEHDFNCPLMSLPLACGTTLQTIPADVPYLSANADLVEKWRNELGPRARPRVGLVWAGRRREPVNRTRDMGLEVCRPLVDLDIDVISLQKEIPDQDGGALESMRIGRLGEKLTDFGDTAALIENLDLVIAVDTVVAHLAGALGKPVWIMLRYSGEWRWLRERSDSPWYPTARIFRQKAPGDWAGLVGDVVRQLQGLLDSRKDPKVPFQDVAR
jgi:tetratricopeptide (TPR) repeat protein